MCESKSVLVSVCLILLVTASFCKYWVYPQKKVRQYGGMKIQNLCENDYKKCCLNGGECYYLIDEDILGCNCTRFYGRKRCEKSMWWTEVRLKKKFSQNRTRFKIFNSKSHML